MMDSEEFIPLIDDVVGTAPQRHDRPWRLLVVDDDSEVHTATDFALHGIRILGRPLAIAHAASAQEARAMLAADRDFAVVLLDVVMETEDAGLSMVGYIRDTLQMHECRIILRTGQPGYAPELSVFNAFDINDYRTKAELTRTRLITAITAALRSYEQIRTIAENRRGLEMIVHAAADLLEMRAITGFAEGVLTQLAALLKLPLDGIVCAQRGSPCAGDPDGLYIVGATGRLVRHIAQPLSHLDDPALIAAIETCIARQQHIFGERHTAIYLKSGDQEAAVFLNTPSPVSAGDRQLIEVFAANIAACFGNVRLVERLHHTAYHDPLTKLPNRTRFILDLDAVARGNDADRVVALLDLQHFADLNDGLSHEVGNALLVAVAERLQQHLGESGHVARIGADVFGLIGPEAKLNPDSLFDLFAAPCAAGEHLLPVAVTLGFCRLLEAGCSGIVLLKRANIALNRAKRNLHGSYEYFIPEMEDSTRWRLQIIRQLRSDFSRSGLTVWYQPQVSLATGRVAGIEALLRWPGESGFVQPPSVFIPLAEYSGLIVDIGDWVLDAACAAFRDIRSLPGAPSRVAVNVSMPQFRSPRFLHQIESALARNDLPPEALELEITETLAMDEPKVVLGCLQKLKKIGLRIAIDDFGTGYSSLSQLRELPIDCLKIDRSFIGEIAGGEGGMFAETIVALGQKLGVSIVAEGVETPEQAAFLRGLACPAAQGFLYAKPMPLDELVAWLRHRQAAYPSV
ncbi:MAG: EAL domain-containing protein [Rhodocyclales bacterium]|nr:EAL domain-containing protein [Rhodocyclales bacterium]